MQRSLYIKEIFHKKIQVNSKHLFNLNFRVGQTENLCRMKYMIRKLSDVCKVWLQVYKCYNLCCKKIFEVLHSIEKQWFQLQHLILPNQPTTYLPYIRENRKIYNRFSMGQVINLLTWSELLLIILTLATSLLYIYFNVTRCNVGRCLQGLKFLIKQQLFYAKVMTERLIIHVD